MTDRAPIDRELEPALDEAELAQVWRRVREAQAEARVAPRRWRYAVATAAAVAALAVLIVAWPRGPHSAGALAGDRPLTPGVHLDAPTPRTIDLADGSALALAADAQLEVLANDGDKFVTAVRRGKVDFDVKPGGPRRWIIETDLATVEVVGTAFAVERGVEGLEVTVARGVVLVRGERVPGRVVRLTAGQHVEVPAPTIAAVPSPVLAVTPSGAASASVTPSPTPVAPAPPDRVALAPTPRRAPIDIIARADELVAAGQPGRAADALAAYLTDAPRDATTGLAAFLLGRLAQDRLGQPGRAADAFARVRDLGTPRAIQEEALGRQARALARAGRLDDAHAAARAYLAQYPRGPHAGEMSTLAGP